MLGILDERLRLSMRKCAADYCRAKRLPDLLSRSPLTFKLVKLPPMSKVVKFSNHADIDVTLLLFSLPGYPRSRSINHNESLGSECFAQAAAAAMVK